MLRAMHWHESFICVQKLSEFPCSNRIAPHCTQVRYGAITALNRCENYVLHTTMFFRKITFLPRDCSASLMFATCDLPTCKILIRKHAYNFMKSAAESRNVILHSIVRSDSLFTSPLWQHWRNLLYVHPF